MKRSPLKRKTPIKPGIGSLQRRTPLPKMSPRRKREMPVRREVREIVLARDRGCVAEGIPGIPHGPLPGHAPLEVNELTRGAGRGSAWLDAACCVSLCAQSHRWVTEHPLQAQIVGLAVPSNLSPEASRLAIGQASWLREKAKGQHGEG